MAYSREELEAAGLDDFRVFLHHVWEHLGLPLPTAVQLDIAWYLQHGPRRKQIRAFRGVGKSFITVAFVLWCLLLNPQLKILVVSAGESLSGDFTKFCLRLIREMPLLQHLQPDTKKGQRESGEAFDVGPARPDKSSSVKSVGITGQIVGSRADIIIADDVETPKNSYTHLQRDRLSHLVREFDSVIKPEDESPANIIYLGTPQVEDSLYVKLEARGYPARVWPAEIPARTDVYKGNLAPMVNRLIASGYQVGDPIEPLRFPKEDLAGRRISNGRAGYALQFMLDTSPADAERHPLKLKNLIIHDVDPEMGHVKIVHGHTKPIEGLESGGFDGDHYVRGVWFSPEMAKYGRRVMAIDPSGMGRDETAYAVILELHGTLYLVDSGGYVDGFGEATLAALASKCLRWGVHDVICETNYGGGMFNSLLKPHLAAVGQGRIDEEWDGWSSTQKELRILDTLQPLIENHRLVVDRKVIEKDLKQQQEDSRYSLVYQYTRMARIKGALQNDDRIEALSMACSYFTAKVSKDRDKGLQRHKDQLLEAELRKFPGQQVLPGGSRRAGRPNWNRRRGA